MNDHYSNREIDMLLESIKQHINDTITSPLKRIEDQTTKTNGRVSSLENWRNYITGAIVILTAGMPFFWIMIDKIFK